MSKRKIAGIIVGGLCAITMIGNAVNPPAAHATGIHNHYCRQGDPPVLASGHTSCPFVGTIVSSYFQSYGPHFYRTRLRSPVTRKSYTITCRRSYEATACSGSNGIWLKFYYENF